LGGNTGVIVFCYARAYFKKYPVCCLGIRYFLVKMREIPPPKNNPKVFIADLSFYILDILYKNCRNI